MKSLFNLDGPVMEFFSKLGDIIYINILFLIFSLPIFTIGAASCGAYYACFKLQKSEGKITNNFIQGFKSNFKKSTSLWLISIGLLLILFIDYKIIVAMGFKNSYLLIGLLMCPAIIILGIQIYAFSLITWFDNSLKSHLKNAFLLSIGKVPLTLIMVMLILAPLLVMVTMPLLFIKTLAAWIGLYFGLVFYLNSKILNNIFVKIENKERPDL